MRNSDPHDAPNGAPNGALERLRHALHQALAGRPKSSAALFPKTAGTRLLAAIQAIGPGRGHRHPPHVAHGVMAFRLHGPETPAPELKYACYGIARQVDWDGRRLIDEPRKIAELLAALSALALLKNGQPPFRDCCRGLLAAWQESAEERARDEAAGDANRWQALGEFLQARGLRQKAGT